MLEAVVQAFQQGRLHAQPIITQRQEEVHHQAYQQDHLHVRAITIQQVLVEEVRQVV